jgi:hemerythrin
MVYTIKHFADEEKLQAKYDYPEYFAHKHLHTDFKELVQGLIAKLHQDGPPATFTSKVYVIIREWLVSHIKNEDLRMAAYIQSKIQAV